VCWLELLVESEALGVRGKSKMNSMSEKSVVWLLATLLLATVSTAKAQQPKKVPRIGYLSSTDPATESAGSEAIRLALGELGYIDGQNIASEYRYAEGKLERLPNLAAELVRLNVDIIVVSGGGRSPRAAKNATKTISIVTMGGGADPIEAGFVESLPVPAATSPALQTLA
jgi:putative ABC transport system substrate-binding protein